MSDTLFAHCPQIPRFVSKIIWIIPILMVPVGIIIYFADTHNFAQLLAIVGASVGFAVLFHYLFKWLNGFIARKNRIEINDRGELTMLLRGKEDKFDLRQIQAFQIVEMPGISQITLIQKDESKKGYAFPGNITSLALDGLKRTLEQFGVVLTV